MTPELKLLSICMAMISLSISKPIKACPESMVNIDGRFCIDKFEAPNQAGALPLVMYSMNEAEAWCQHKGKRLCFEDEWTRACVGQRRLPWSYGNKHKPGMCNDGKLWKQYVPRLLRRWSDQSSDVHRHDFSSQSYGNDTSSYRHVKRLYQAEPSGHNMGCVTEEGVFDLLGNVEEWTRRRWSSRRSFSGNLKGRFWSEERSCAQSVKNHGDLFGFYETGFRCCL